MAKKTPKTVDQYLGGFLREQRTDGTRRAYGQAVRDFLAYADVKSLEDLDALDRDWAVEYRNHLAERKKRAKTYVNRQLSALRGYFRWLLAEEAIEKSPFDLVRGYKVSQESRTEGLEEDEISKMLAAAREDDRLAGLRDRALLLTLYYQGLRRSEAARINHQDLRRESKILVLRDTKTTDRDEVSLRPEVTEAIDLYTDALDRKLKRSGPGRKDPVFVSHARPTLGRRLSPTAMLEIVKQRAREAGIRRNIVCHSLRHACVTHALDHLATLEEAGAHVRHKDPRTTARYDRKRKRRGAKAALALPHLAG